MADLPPHGTYARYQQEKLAGWDSAPCEACKAANRAYQAGYRARTGKNRGLRVSTGCVRGLGWPYADPGLARMLAGRHG